MYALLTGGAGGKGVWGPPGEVYDLEEVDVKDPNYDEDQVMFPNTRLPENNFAAFLSC